MRKPTIYEVLRDKLGREPTNKEICDRVRELMREAFVDAANKGKLRHQRRG